ncbi:MAG: glycosyltransferase family 1 protein [Planctomycetota bacterium]|nr:glycosyltransferase family 1 protein [Planctomycetota bacterium]MCX8039850.1 glycosyltransferase family 1 protein [Planctomycetota bacterium]MDW8372819.1 glycosyltransferase family 1 protein [Planctomycetota bacterium]
MNEQPPLLLSIALVTETYPPEINGVSMTMARLVQGLVARGHRVQVVRPRQRGESWRRRRAPAAAAAPAGERVDELLRPGLPIPGYRALRLGLPSTRALIHAWRRQRPDVVHIVTEGPLGSSALRAARALAIPVSSSYHTNFHDYARHYRVGAFAGVVESWLRHLHNRTAVTLVPSRDILERLERAGYRNCELWSRGVDVELFDPARRDPQLRAQWGAGPEDCVCLHVGRIAAEKDIPLALAAYAAIRERQARARMVVVGDGPLRAALAAKHPEVLFTGAVPTEQLAAMYASSDLFLFPSQSETFGNVLCEAMASGLPCVAFRYAAAAMHGRDGENLLAVPLGDRQAFIAAAVRLADDPALRARLGSAARQAMLANAWDRVIDRFEDVLRRLVLRERTMALEALCT